MTLPYFFVQDFTALFVQHSVASKYSLVLSSTSTGTQSPQNQFNDRKYEENCTNRQEKTRISLVCNSQVAKVQLQVQFDAPKLMLQA